jgi:hypothetical protein
MASQPQRFLSLPFCLALTGLLFSLWNLRGDTSALCVTEGCSLFQDFTVADISLWWLGVAGFGALALASLSGFVRMGQILAALGLALDSLLLLIMLLTAPCLTCLIAGLLLALSFAAFRAATRREQRQRGKQPGSMILSCWTLLLLLNMGMLIHLAAGPWALPGQRADSGAPASVQIYFSPSCAACLTLVQAGAGDNPAFADAEWLPVAETRRDLWVIADMKLRMDNGASLAAAMEASLAATPDVLPPRAQLSPGLLLVQFRLWRNRAHILNSGSTRLPFVEFRGLPGFLLPQPRSESNRDAAPASPSPWEAESGNLPFLGVTGFCEDGVPCDAGTAGTGLQDLMRGE